MLGTVMSPNNDGSESEIPKGLSSSNNIAGDEVVVVVVVLKWAGLWSPRLPPPPLLLGSDASPNNDGSESEIPKGLSSSKSIDVAGSALASGEVVAVAGCE
jgi:hypothetical protein